nr:factor of DNA methylation 4-like [Ipomoea batatas]GMD78103.1 factor of DNA methylation 4-like [Ipomoea batatas]GMD78105.1 factor of DNA methylation 4-like [Ipomoea batatas]
MRAPTAGLAVPRRIPQPVVCGQLRSSHKPIIGRTDATRALSISSLVKRPAHFSLKITVHMTFMNPITYAHAKATIAASLALAKTVTRKIYQHKVSKGLKDSRANICGREGKNFDKKSFIRAAKLKYLKEESIIKALEAFVVATSEHGGILQF